MAAALARGLRERPGGRAAEAGEGAVEFETSVVSIAPLRPGGVWEQLRAEGIGVESLNMRGLWQLPWAWLRWRRLLGRVRPDLVHSILIHANILSYIGRFPRGGGGAGGRPAYVQAIHTLQDRPRWHWWVQGWLTPRADGFIVTHPAILEKIPGARRGADRGRQVVIPNGIELERFGQAEAASWPDSTSSHEVVFSTPILSNHTPATPGESPRKPPAEARVVGYVGRFDPVKRLDRLVKAFAIVRRNCSFGNKLHLILVGYGVGEAALRQQVQHLQLADWVHFPGVTATPERWYKLFDVMVLPSEVEGFGLPIVEAWAAGVPVVAVDSPAVRYLVEQCELGGESRGIITVAKAGSAEMLAEKIQEVMENIDGCWGRDFRAQVSRKMSAKAFSEATMIDRYMKFLKIFVDFKAPQDRNS